MRFVRVCGLHQYQVWQFFGANFEFAFAHFPFEYCQRLYWDAGAYTAVYCSAEEGVVFEECTFERIHLCVGALENAPAAELPIKNEQKQLNLNVNTTCTFLNCKFTDITLKAITVHDGVSALLKKVEIEGAVDCLLYTSDAADE